MKHTQAYLDLVTLVLGNKSDRKKLLKEWFPNATPKQLNDPKAFDAFADAVITAIRERLDSISDPSDSVEYIEGRMRTTMPAGRALGANVAVALAGAASDKDVLAATRAANVVTSSQVEETEEVTA